MVGTPSSRARIRTETTSTFEALTPPKSPNTGDDDKRWDRWWWWWWCDDKEDEDEDEDAEEEEKDFLKLKLSLSKLKLTLVCCTPKKLGP